MVEINVYIMIGLIFAVGVASGYYATEKFYLHDCEERCINFIEYNKQHICFSDDNNLENEVFEWFNYTVVVNNGSIYT